MAPSVSLESVYGVLRERIGSGDADTSHMARLAGQGADAVLEKPGEECCEALPAAKGGNRAAAIHEAADLQFHPPIRMACADITPEDAERERGSRFGHSGLSERSPP